MEPLVAEPADDGPPDPYWNITPVPKSRRWLLRAAAGGAVGLAVMIALFTIATLGFRNGCSSPLEIFSGPQDGDLLVWAPADTDGVFVADLEEFFSERSVREVFADGEHKAFRDAGFDIGSVQRLAWIARVNKSSSFDNFLVIRLAKAFDPNGPIKTGRAKVKYNGDKKYLEFTNGHWLFNPTEHTVLLSDNEPFLLEAMKGNGTEIRIGRDLLKVVRSTDGPVRGAAVGPAAQPDARGYFRELLRLEKNPDPHPLRLSESYSSRITSDFTEFTLVATYSSPEKAKVALDQINFGVKHGMNKEIAARDAHDPGLHFARVIHDSLKLEQSGPQVTIRFQIPHRELRRLKALLK